MENLTKPFCRICSNVITDKNLTVIEEVIRDVLDVLFIKLDLDITEPQVLCALCSTKLFAACAFKSACMDTEDDILTYINDEEITTIDIKDFYLKKKGNEQPVSNMLNNEVCRLCTKLINYGFMHLKSISDRDIIQGYIPELNLKATKDPVICEQCCHSLEVHSGFIKKCLDREKKMKRSDVEAQVVDEIDIKIEEIEVKSEGDAQDSSKAETDVDYGEVAIEEAGCARKEITFTKRNGNEPLLSGIANDLRELPACRCDLCAAKHKDASKTRIFRCDKCDYRTKYQGNLRNHHITHKESSEVSIYRCNRCGLQTKWKGCLTRHLQRFKNHSKLLMFSCDKCDYQSKWKCDLKRHRAIHKDPSQGHMLKCGKCDDQSKRSASHTLHQNIHNVNLKRHMIEEHTAKHQGTDKNSSEAQVYKCVAFSYETNHTGHPLRHKDASNTRVFRCDMCDYHSKYQSAVKNHHITHKESSEVSVYRCNWCGLQTKWKGCLARHLRRFKNHSKLLMFSCDKCDYQSKWKCDLKKHRAIHKDPAELRMHKCHKCDDQSKRNAGDTLHQNIHNLNLKRHIRVKHSAKHRGTDKNSSEAHVYKCVAFSYETKHKTNHTCHPLRHKDSSKTRIFRCDKCNYHTKYRGNLRNHHITHREFSEVSVYRCNGCGLQTKWKGCLTRHLQRFKNHSK